MAGHVDGGLPSLDRHYGRRRSDCDGTLPHTGSRIFSAQLFNEREGRLWGRLGAFDDRTVFRLFPMFSYFIDRAFAGIDGGSRIAFAKKSKAG